MTLVAAYRRAVLAGILSLVSAGFGASASVAEQVQIPIRWADGKVVSDPEGVEITFTARRADGQGETLVREVSAPTHVSLELPPETQWIFEVEGPEVWAARRNYRTVEAGGEARVEPIRLWPTVYLQGALAVEDGEPPPPEIRARFQAVPREGTTAEEPTGEVTCPVREKAFACRLPVARLDIRLRAEAHISHYLWGVELAAQKPTQVGTLRLLRGASVTGWVSAPGVGLKDSVQVRMEPLPTRLPTPDGDPRRHQRLHETRPSARGFFHFEGIAPGSYQLTAVQDGLAPAKISPVLVLETSETSLDASLVLEPYLEVTFVFDPPLAPDGATWKAWLGARTAAQYLPTAAQGEVDSGGTWKVPGLVPGDYRVRLHSGQDRWLYREVTLSPAEDTVFLEIPTVRVEGLVTLGKEPIPARLVFGGETGAVRLSMTADEEGRFFGALPRDGRWRVTVIHEESQIHQGRMVEIEAEGGEAWVELALDDGVVAGIVVDGDGEPVGDAVVTAFPLTHSAFSVQKNADAEGRFRFQGLDREAPLSLQAESGLRVSEYQTVDLSIEREAGLDLELVVRPEVTLEGRVVGPQGAISGALVAAAVVGTHYSNEGVTDASGRFSFRLPQRLEEVGQVDLVILPPGFPLTALRRTVQSGRSLTVRVDQRQAGTIVMKNLEWLQTAGSGEQAVLVHEGILLPALIVARWVQLNGAPMELQAGGWSIPLMKAGPYALCVFHVGLLQELDAWQLPAEMPCTQGILEPGGSLSLALPSPPS